MTLNAKTQISIAMGVIIAAADIYWTYTSYQVAIWLALGIVILLADVAWLAIDISYLRSPKVATPSARQRSTPTRP